MIYEVWNTCVFSWCIYTHCLLTSVLYDLFCSKVFGQDLSTQVGKQILQMKQSFDSFPEEKARHCIVGSHSQ